MSYRRSLLFRWSRRDTLAVLIVAISVAFLVGTIVLVVGVGSQSTQMAATYGTPTAVSFHDSLSEAETVAGPNATILEYAAVTGPNDESSLVVGRPSDSAGGATGTVVGHHEGTTLGTIQDSREQTLEGAQGTVTVTVTDRRSGSVDVPSRWYVANSSVVSELGPTGAIVLHPSSTNEVPHGAPLRSVLLFFILGTREVVGTIGVVALGSSVLVGVVVWSVIRMSVLDRIRTIRVVRATGGTPMTILGLFVARAMLLTAVGLLLGFAIGVVSVNAAVNLGVFLGLPISVDVTIGQSTALLIGGLGLAMCVVGPAAGFLAALPSSRCDPASLTGTSAKTRSRNNPREKYPTVMGSVLSSLQPTILPWRALIPTTATLAVFVAFVVLISGMAGVVAPMTSSDGATITQPGAIHPIASTVSDSQVRTLQNRGIAASGEILLFEVRNGQPYLARGVNFTDYSSVTDVTLVRGREPRAMDEALVGQELATTLGISVGDRLPIGGSTKLSFDRVEVVGMFDADGHYDDELLVSLQLARELEEDKPNTVQFIRAERLPESVQTRRSSIYVETLSAPSKVTRGSSIPVAVTLRNAGDSRSTRDVTISVGDVEQTRRITLDPGERVTVRTTFNADTLGRIVVRVGASRQAVDVVPPNGIRIGYAPEQAPLNSSPIVVVQTPFGEPVSNATISVDDQMARTNEEGIARILLSDPGRHRIIVRKGGQEVSRNISVREELSRRATLDVTVRPNSPDFKTSPTAVVTLFNPWNQTLTHTLDLAGPGVKSTREVSVDPGDTRRIEFTLERRPPGSYTVTASLDSADSGVTATYNVTGDERVFAAMASSARPGKSGLGRTVETALGNLRFVLALLVILAGAMGVGGTTASFAQAVQSRRRTIGIYRATGASPISIVKVVLGDALKIGFISSSLALGIAIVGLDVVDNAGYLTVFGVRLAPTYSPRVVSGILIGALIVTILGAGLATWALLRTQPWQLLTSSSARNLDESGGGWNEEWGR